MKCLSIFFFFIGIASAVYVSHLVFYELLIINSPYQYCHHHYKSNCVVTNNTFIIKKCRTIPLGRYVGTLVMSAEYGRTLMKPRVSFNWAKWIGF
jgi:hypothetical protein